MPQVNGKKMKRMVRHTVLLLLLLLGVAGEGYAQLRSHGPNKSLRGIEVHFRFDKSKLDLDYMGNRETFDEFAFIIDSIGLHKIDSVVIVSQSSPEGVYEHNMKLSQRRARTMRHAIEQRHPELADRLHVHPDGESWEQLREYVVNDTKMKRSTIERVLAVIDDNTISIGTKKWRMQQLPVYRYLLQTYYPRIRNSVFCIIYYDIPVEMAQLPAPVEAPALVDSIAPFPMVVASLQAPSQYEPVLNVRTNLLYDLATVTNIGVEYYPRNPHWSVAGHYTFPWWSNDAKHYYLQLLDWNLEARYYFDGNKSHAGWYVAPYVHWNLYDFSFNAEDAWQGEGWGTGLGLGYVWQPWKNKHWKLEAFARVGYYHTLFDPYHASDPYNGKYYYDWPYSPEGFTPRNHRLRWFGPTGAGITISYDLFKRKIKK